jgi:hypothetical protein
MHRRGILKHMVTLILTNYSCYINHLTKKAKGTGTRIGDPIEADAIGSVFRNSRSADDPLYL